MKRFILFCLFCLFLCSNKSQAAESVTSEITSEISLQEVEETFQSFQEQGSSFSIKQYVEDVLAGKTTFSLNHILSEIGNQMISQFMSYKNVLLRILAISVLAGIFVNLAGILGEKSLSETGFFISMLLIASIAAGSFHLAFSVTEQALGQLVTFMKVLIPSISLSLCYSANSGTSLVFYESMLLLIAGMEMLTVYIFLPGVKIYFLLCLMNPLSENRFTKLAGLIKSFLKWGSRVSLAFLVGYQGIQGMLMPVMDRAKNSAILQTAKGLPGVGNTVGSVADTMVSSGMLIKSALGIGGIICIFLLCAYPLLKVLVYTVLYKVCEAVVQPVSDKKVVSVLQAAVDTGKLLLEFLVCGALTFLLSIAIVVLCTNLV